MDASQEQPRQAAAHHEKNNPTIGKKNKVGGA
jgi:hypothetical protein